MRLTTKGRYAVTAMLDLALHGTDRPVSLADISGRQAISLSYLEQLFAKMRRNKLVISTRGPGGGYSLENSPEDVCIADVISAVDEEMSVTNKDVMNGSTDFEPCLTEQLWEELSEQIQNYLTTISLADMMQNDEVMSLSRDHDLRQKTPNLL